MPAPEHIFHRPYVVFAPDDRTGDDASGKFRSQQLQDPAPHDQDQSLPDIEPLASDHARHTNAFPESTSEPQKQTLENLSGPWLIDKDDFIWDEALSANGQKLWPWLLEANKIEFLEWRAAEEGWDLNAALEELRRHGWLEECEPGYFRIIQSDL